MDGAPGYEAWRSLAVVTNWPVWRWVWSAQWIKRPATVVESWLRPTPAGSAKRLGWIARMRTAEVARAVRNSARASAAVLPSSSVLRAESWAGVS